MNKMRRETFKSCLNCRFVKMENKIMIFCYPTIEDRKCAEKVSDIYEESKKKV